MFTFINHIIHKMSTKIVSWNVNSIRKGVHDTLIDLINSHSPDIICFQETKSSGKDAEKFLNSLDNPIIIDTYPYRYWNDSVKGHAGVAIFSKIKPNNVYYEIPRLFQLNNGRIIIAEFNTFTIFNTYVPNTGRGQIAEDYRNLWHTAIMSWLTDQFNKSTKLIWSGDLNVVSEPHLDTSHHLVRPINPCAGMKQFEKDHLNDYFNIGLIDVFRHLYPDTKSFTWFSPLNKSVGWRLDYFLVNDISIIQDIIHNEKLSSKISDHTWIMLLIKSSN